MHLKEFSLFSPVVESTDVFQAIETAIPSAVIEQTVSNTQAKQERKRKLRSELVVCLVIAMSLWSSDSIALSLEKSGQWIESAVDKTREILASTK